jgi:hypothetical protein
MIDCRSADRPWKRSPIAPTYRYCRKTSIEKLENDWPNQVAEVAIRLLDRRGADACSTMCRAASTRRPSEGGHSPRLTPAGFTIHADAGHLVWRCKAHRCSRNGPTAPSCRECGVRPRRCRDRGTQEQNAGIKFAGFSSGFRGPHRCAERPRTACRGRRASGATARRRSSISPKTLTAAFATPLRGQLTFNFCHHASETS